VIVWLNGPFGVGKTTVAASLRDSLPGSAIFDPEICGYLLRRLVPGIRERDYQDVAFWRWLTREGAWLWQSSGRVVVVPMTITNEHYFAEIVERLGKRADVRHFTLMAPPDEIVRRVSGRADPTWARERIDRSIAILSAARFAEHIDTTDRSAVEVAALIRGRVGYARSRSEP
jgi:predicted kinase